MPKEQKTEFVAAMESIKKRKKADPCTLVRLGLLHPGSGEKLVASPGDGTGLHSTAAGRSEGAPDVPGGA